MKKFKFLKLNKRMDSENNVSEELRQKNTIKVVWPDDEGDILPVENVKTSTEAPRAPDKPKAIVEELGLFDKPIIIDVPDDPKVKKSKKYCGKIIIKNGEEKKCRELFGNCSYHICEKCRTEKLPSDDCVHKERVNLDIGPPRFSKEFAAEHYVNLHMSMYYLMENILKRKDMGVRVDGLTQTLMDKRDMYKNAWGDVYEVYGAEYLDNVFNPITTLAIMSASDIGGVMYTGEKNE
jgi:hypothetical protein